MPSPFFARLLRPIRGMFTTNSNCVNLPLFIARRIYHDEDDRKKVSRPAIRIATAGVSIGLAVMIISVCVVLGFKHTIRDKVIGFGSHINVAEYMALQHESPYPVCMDDSTIDLLSHISGVRHVQRYALKQGILKTDDDFLGVTFKGIGPEYDTTFLAHSLVSGEMPLFSDEKSSNRILISQIIANKLQVKTGDRIFAYFMGDNNVRTRRFTICGIYRTDLKHFDESLCFTDLSAVVKLNGWERDQASGAEILVHDFDKIDEVDFLLSTIIDRTDDKYGYTYSSLPTQQSYPQIFSWLDLLDLDVWIILALMVAVAGFTMISGLLIIIIERTSMIGTLKALGAKNKTIRHTFLWFAVFIIVKGMVIGNLLGIGLCVLQHVTGIVKLDPEAYYVDVVPVELNLPVIAVINVATLLVSVAVLIAPSFLISHIHPAKSIKYE